MSSLKNLTGKRYGRLTTICQSGRSKQGNVLWICECDCGARMVASSDNLQSGNTKSCGCLKKEIVIDRNFRHGHSTRHNKSKLYRAWTHITQRCNNPNDKAYQHYGGRGISVCKRWTKFMNFCEDMGEPPTDRHSIDRINNNGNYCKSNCRWATQAEQSRNTRRNRLMTFRGKTQCMADWSKELNINPSTIYNRIKRGWSVERALTRRKETK